jgi:cytochrome b561
MHKDVKRYATGSKVLHWVIAFLVITMLSCSFFLDDLPDTLKANAYMIHKSVGLTLLVLMLIRWFWIIKHGKPALPATVSRWEGLFAHSVQYSLYGLMIAMPLCGWVMSVASNHTPVYFGLFQLPIPGIKADEALAHGMNLTHKTIAWSLIALIFLHVAGALKHHFIDKDTLLRRMLTDG